MHVSVQSTLLELTHGCVLKLWLTLCSIKNERTYASLRWRPSSESLRTRFAIRPHKVIFTACATSPSILLSVSRSEFCKIFEPYGTVTHAVILATLDSASRRRGFIVMSTHQEAKIAMDSLSRTQIKFLLKFFAIEFPLNSLLRGHMLDVSWAVVQRSQGPVP